MFLNKKSSKSIQRQRQPLTHDNSGAKPVFSYHARSARTEPTGARSTKFLWTNPSKPPSPRPSTKKLPKRLITIIAVVMGLILVVNSLILSRNPTVVILAADASSNLIIKEQEIYHQAARNIISGSLGNVTKLTVNTQRISEAMLEQFPELEHVSVTLPLFGRQPIIYLEPVRPALLLKTVTGETFVLSASGRAVMAVSQSSKLKKSGLALVEDQSGLSVRVNGSALPSDNVAFITEVLAQLRAKKLKVSSLVLPLGTSELHLKVEGYSYIVKFNLRGDARVEVGAYLAVKQHLAREGKKPRSYIDVRVDNRAYYK